LRRVVRRRGDDLTAENSRWVILVVHFAVLAVPPVIVSVGVLGERATASPALALSAGSGVLALQLRHSLAIARGKQPRAAVATILALAVLVYLPLPWFGWGWAAEQACLMASTPLLMRGRLAMAASAAPVLATMIFVVVDLYHQPLSDILYWAGYESFTLVVVAAVLYGSARMVAVLEELRRTRRELAEFAVRRERLRVSRDLHDLLGQSLSAVSLKGDLAVRLLPGDAPAAWAEVESLTQVAREALRDIRAISRDQHMVSLRAEIEGAATLAVAANIATTVQVDLPDLPPAVERTLAWAVREAVTNVLRHSRATTCAITAGTRGDIAYLCVVNNGAHPILNDGAGLPGLAERVRALSGSVTAGPTGHGEFHLLVELPRETP
jgi:two-component system sensor histidine kinase DesK